jgi:AcrR family transcriptional regulator
LFARDGFHATTIPDIAEAADVAPRTVSTYFPSKEGIVFDVYEAAIERFAARLAHRAQGVPVHDVLREWLLSEDEQQQGPTRGVVPSKSGDDADFARLREAAISTDPDLWALQRRCMLPMVGLVAHALADDLDIEPDSLQALIVGETTVAVLLAINARAARSDTAAMEEFDAALDFMRTRLMADAI